MTTILVWLMLADPTDRIDLREAIGRVVNGWNLPPLTDSADLPPPWVIDQWTDFAYGHIVWLQNQTIMQPWSNPFDQLREAEALQDYWQEARVAVNPGFSTYMRRQSLKRLRALTPVWGQWPPHVPIWRFHDEP